ncbi:hypothetical protein ACFL0T_08435 [Candidatus Omnitrophota bacterium]
MGKKRLVAIIIILLIAIPVLTIVNFSILLEKTPKYIRYYANVGGQLPLITQLYFNISMLAKRFFILSLLIMPAVYIGFIVLAVLSKNKLIPLVVFGVISVILVLMLFIGDAALEIPLVQMLRILGKQSTAEEIKSTRQMIEDGKGPFLVPKVKRAFGD